MQCASVYSIASQKGDDDERPTNSTLCNNLNCFIELNGAFYPFNPLLKFSFSNLFCIKADLLILTYSQTKSF